jgi:alpha,alpha-trehalase
MIPSVHCSYNILRRIKRRVLALAVLLASTNGIAQASSDAALYADLSADFARLAPQTIRPADGYIKFPYLIPAGYYNQMWDWDGFFIGLHWANQNAADAKYLRDWALGFASSADADGYVAGCITPKGPRPLFGKFAMKPFLAQGALIAA